MHGGPVSRSLLGLHGTRRPYSTLPLLEVAMSQNRREFLSSTVPAASALSLAACTDRFARVLTPTRAAFDRLDARVALSQIDHVIVVMMENRSFDHFLGWHPRADGRQAGLMYVDRNGDTQRTYALA